MDKSEDLSVGGEWGWSGDEVDGMVEGEGEKFVEMVVRGEKRKVERTKGVIFKRTPFS